MLCVYIRPFLKDVRGSFLNLHIENKDLELVHRHV